MRCRGERGVRPPFRAAGASAADADGPGDAFEASGAPADGSDAPAPASGAASDDFGAATRDSDAAPLSVPDDAPAGGTSSGRPRSDRGSRTT